ncbi:MAG: Ribose-5-phosphate isomerase A [Chlamydiae bacterium]|nr:Ribose-5-phosphate isomerase A [Chlamydiota bacterium]
MSFTNQKSPAKEAAGAEAAKLIQNNMIVGLGTGSTAFFFIQGLIKRCKKGLKIKAVSSSKSSEQLARDGGIEVLDLNDIEKIDMTVDGSDEIDHQKRMIKGGGGALLREKIVVNASDEMVVIVDESKVVDELGEFPLPLEVVPFGYELTKKQIEKKGYRTTVRKKENEIYITDNGNYIIDVQFKHLSGTPEDHEEVLKNIPGVLETGFFFNLAGRVIIGDHEGKVEIWK